MALVDARSASLAEPLIEWTIRLCGWSAIFFVFAIFFFVFREGAPPLFGRWISASSSPASTGGPTRASAPQFGVLALIAGTASVTLLAAVIAVPAGLGAAVFVSEFCAPRLRETLKIVIELLAAIPSVVWGFIGYMVLNPLIIWATGAPIGINILNGGIILALMSVPDHHVGRRGRPQAVPDTYREAAVALGASRWQLVYKVLLPAAKNGLLAAALLGVGRAVGETMAVLMATGHAIQIPDSLLDPVRTLTATIAAELGEAVEGGKHYQALFVIGTLLMVMSLVVNLTADLVVKGIRGRQNV